jgi:DDE superfamily endonuclease
MGCLTKWTARQMLLLDESAVNERSLERRKGWAPRGVTPYQVLPFKRSERWSLLLCYGSRGFVCHDVVHGSFTAATYNAFIVEQVLPRCNPFPGSNSVLCMDNARIHCSEVCLLHLLLAITDAFIRNYEQYVKRLAS